METSTPQLDHLARILIRCFLLSVGLLIFWLVFYLLAGEWAYELHAKWFEITRRDFDLINYCGMGFVKLLAFVLFLVPYVSIRLVLRRD